MANKVIADDLTADEVFIDDAVEHRWGAVAIPCAFWINDCDGAVETDTQAICLCAEDVWGVEAEGGQATFEVIPCDE